MGYYINPTDGLTKEEFLAKYGTKISPVMAAEFNYIDDTGYLPVCWVNNGPFTAAAIAIDQREMDEFQAPDPRPKKWYFVPKSVLNPFL